jgi:hypothetical protein
LIERREIFLERRLEAVTFLLYALGVCCMIWGSLIVVLAHTFCLSGDEHPAPTRWPMSINALLDRLVAIFRQALVHVLTANLTSPVNQYIHMT